MAKKKKYIPTLDRIFVRPDPAPEKIGKVIVPHAAAHHVKPHEGTVVAVGPGRRGPEGGLIAMTTKPEDKILYAESAGSPMQIGNEKLLVMQESQIVANIEEVD